MVNSSDFGKFLRFSISSRIYKFRGFWPWWNWWILIKSVDFVFVHDGINSVANYNSLRVGVGWMSDVGCRMDVCPSRGKFHDRITFKRLKILSLNFVWCLILMICLGNEPMEKMGPPQPPQPPYPPPNWCNGLTSTIFVRFWWNWVWKFFLEGNT